MSGIRSRIVIGALCMAACTPSKTPGSAAATSTPSASQVVPSAAAPSASSAAPGSSAAAPGPTGIAMQPFEMHITSEAPGLNPDGLDAAKRAKMFWNHRLVVTKDTARVEHVGLKKQWAFKTVAEVAEAVAGIDWKALASATQSEAPQEGGTVFRVAFRRGEERYAITTMNVDAHPKLRHVMGLIHKRSGVP